MDDWNTKQYYHKRNQGKQSNNKKVITGDPDGLVSSVSYIHLLCSTLQNWYVVKNTRNDIKMCCRIGINREAHITQKKLTVTCYSRKLIVNIKGRHNADIEISDEKENLRHL